MTLDRSAWLGRPNGNPLFGSFTKETWVATARGRVGYAFNNLLFYGTGGYAAAGVGQGIYDNAHNMLASTSSTRSGWTAGGGLRMGICAELVGQVRMALHEVQHRGPHHTVGGRAA